MIIAEGEKILIIHRPLFQGDARRHFIGQVESVSLPLIRASGYVYAADPRTNQFRRHDPMRTRLIALDADAIIVNVLPPQVSIEAIEYKYRAGADTSLSDGSDWHLDVSHL